jgi:hypothetical protein
MDIIIRPRENARWSMRTSFRRSQSAPFLPHQHTMINAFAVIITMVSSRKIRLFSMSLVALALGCRTAWLWLLLWQSPATVRPAQWFWTDLKWCQCVHHLFIFTISLTWSCSLSIRASFVLGRQAAIRDQHGKWFSPVSIPHSQSALASALGCRAAWLWLLLWQSPVTKREAY